MPSKQRIPEWIQKVTGWIILTILTLYTTTAVTKSRTDALEAWKNQHEAMQLQTTVNKQAFDQFTVDLNKRLDRLEDKIDKANERELNRPRKY